MQRNAAEAYKTQAIMTAPPAKLVAMCYDRAIGALGDCVRAIEAGDIERRCNNSTRAANIIAHLWSTLDLEQGGDIARNLSDIYNAAMRRLSDINMKNDADAAREVIELLRPLAQSWNELADRGEQMPGPAVMPQPQSPARRPAPQRPAASGPAARTGGIAINV